jgi:hypothetical protein
MRVVGWLVIALACGKGPCDKLCVNLSTYAEECGFSVPDADLDACMSAWDDATSDEKKVCRDYGDPETLRVEWTCDDLQAYWSSSEG